MAGVVKLTVCGPAGILRRVLIIILVATVGGTALFFLGLKFAFPEYR